MSRFGRGPGKQSMKRKQKSHSSILLERSTKDRVFSIQNVPHEAPAIVASCVSETDVFSVQYSRTRKTATLIFSNKGLDEYNSAW